MKRSWVWVALLLSLGVNIGILATLGTARFRERPRYDGARPEGAPPFARMADHLGLEGETREQFLTIQEDLFKTTRRHRQELESLRRELRREVVSQQPDAARVEQLLEESGEVSRRLDRAMVDSVLATRRVLTPEQQQRYFRVLDRLRAGGRRFGPHAPPPDGRRPHADRPPPPREK